VEAGGQGQIVVVDDDRDILDSVCDVLASAGYTSLPFSDGRAALAAMRIFRPALLITDLDMPGISGTELVERLRGEEDLQSLPVLVLSSDPSRRPARSCWLEKPFEIGALLQKVRSLFAGLPCCAQRRRGA